MRISIPCQTSHDTLYNHLLMEIVGQGIILGLGLSILIGPIFVAQSQASFTLGFYGGMMINFGVWTSDLIISLCSLYFVEEMRGLSRHPVFIHSVGIAGATLLLIIGLFLLFKKVNIPMNHEKSPPRTSGRLILKGFLVNTLNPFTFSFWMGVMSSYVIYQNLSRSQGFILITSILAVIMATDSLKVYFAHRLSKKLNKELVSRFNRISGAVFVIFALALIFRLSEFV